MSASTIMSTNTELYKYTASVTFVVDGEVHELEPVNVRTIAIDYDYDKNNMPMIFMTLGVYKSLANKMILMQDKGIFILNLKRAVVNSDMPDLYQDYIDDKFIYFITGEVDQSQDTTEITEDELDDDTTVSVGLLSQDHVNKNKKSVNGILNGNLSSIMYYLTSHLPIVIEPPAKNINMTNIILPPQNSVAKSLKYLNSINVFYDTPYRFFIDFDRSYLVSSSGKAIKAKGEDIGTVMIIIRHDEEFDAKIQGMVTNKEQALYEVLINSKDCELSDNTMVNKSFSKITATTADGQHLDATSTTKSEDSNVKTKTRNIRVSNNNTGLLQNMVTSMDQTSIQLLVQKTDVDASAFTMNKEYIIRANDAYKTETYNGRYLLTRKRELYIREDEKFTVNVMLLFKKVPE